jgi:hypothetical protein
VRRGEQVSPTPPGLVDRCEAILTAWPPPVLHDRVFNRPGSTNVLASIALTPDEARWARRVHRAYCAECRTLRTRLNLTVTDTGDLE